MSSLSSAGGSECWSSDEIPLSGIALHFFGNDEGCEVDRTETATPVQLRLFREVEATVAVCSLDTAAVADHNCSSLLPLGDILSEVIVEIGDKVEYSPDAPRHLHLNFALNAMPAILRYALGLGDIEVLTVTLKFDSNKFGASTQPQCAVTCSKTQDPQPSQQNGCDEPSHLPAEPMLPDTDDLQHSAPADQEDPLTCCGPKPVACNQPMCTYQVDELGYGASMAAIHQEPLVADLLISLAAQAAGNPNSKHRQRFFACPYPPSDFVCATKRASNTSGPDDNMGIEWAELKQVFLDLPTVAEMSAAKDLKKFLDKHNPRAYRLVRWVLSTCRVHIVQLQPEDLIGKMGGYQFKLFTNTFDREVAFQKLKQQHGSSYAFHGSRFMNWHSILRTSLQNFSNSQYMLNGAAHGSGVYVSPHVINNHDAVAARYLFVYAEGNTAPSVTVDCMDIPKWD